MVDRLKIQNALGRLASVEADLGDPLVLSDAKRYRKTLRDHAFLKKLESAYGAWEKALSDIAGNEELLSDPDFKAEAEAEIAALKESLPALERKVMASLVEPDPFDSRNAVMEIRAGTGGEEAALFAGDLFRMYSRYCETQGWKISVMHANETTLDGYKEIVFTVLGEGSYGRFRFESGGHRVQRVPETEAQGRIHTSAATVAVFPEAEEEDELVIRNEDLRIDTYRSGGAGGQHVNKTDSAVRITHLPTGIVVQSDEERSQHQNKEKCMSVLRSKILAAQREAEEAKMGAERKMMVGSGDRSERIRTYNFPQNRLTDHRIGLTLYSLDRIMEGLLDELLDALVSRNEDLRLAAQLSRIAEGGGAPA